MLGDRQIVYVKVEKLFLGDSPESTTSLRSVRNSGTVPSSSQSIVYNVKGRVRLTVMGTVPKSQISYGDTIIVKAKLRKPRGYHNFGGYSYEEALARDGIYVVGTALAEDVRILSNGRGTPKSLLDFLGTSGGNPLLRKIYGWREHIRMAIDKSFSERTAAILTAMIIGDDRKLSDELRDKFMASGTAHILSISGAHVGLIAFVFYNLIRLSILHLPYTLLLRLTLYTSPSKIAAIGTIPVVIFYTVIAGSKISAVRALIMIIVYLLAIVIEREKDWKNSIALAAVITLLWNPQSLFDISFQLSYGAVVFIGYAIEYSSKLKVKSVELKNLKNTEGGNRFKKKIFDYVLITVAATLGTVPLVAYYFNQFTWTGLFSNLIIIPLTGVLVLPLGLLATMVSLILNIPTIPFSSLIEYSVTLFYQIVEFFAHLPYSVVRLPSPSILIIFLYYILLWLLAKIIFPHPPPLPAPLCGARPGTGGVEGEGGESRSKMWKTASAVSLLIILLISVPVAFDKNALKVTFLDVGQGDSVLVELPDKRK
ncbi:MAG: ComEC/Rec2 family competence protein, partial [Nitrospirota bacterium]